MSCPHSLKPGPCSQCLGIAPKRVTQRGQELLVDGEPLGRTLDTESQRTDYGRARERKQKP